MRMMINLLRTDRKVGLAPAPEALPWPDLPADEREMLCQLEVLAGEVNAEHTMSPTGNAELAAFAGTVYRALHWVSTPACRAHHPTWGPASAPIAAGAGATRAATTVTPAADRVAPAGWMTIAEAPVENDASPSTRGGWARASD